VENIVSNPNKVVDWTIGAQLCRDLHDQFKEKACQQCPLFNEHITQKFGALETITPSECNMFDNVVTPLVSSNSEVKPKDKASYEYFRSTGTYKYF
jgi:hypothetical protein